MKKTTYQIISELPKDATEWQKDSAVQAYFHPGENNHYSDQPDTLGLPGQRADATHIVDYGKLCRPDAFADTLFQGRSTAQVGLSVPDVPYHTGSDWLISSSLIIGMLAAILAFAVSRGFVERQVKNFFYTENERTTTIPDTTSELRNQILLVAFTCLILAVAYYCYALFWNGNQFDVASNSQLIGIYIAAFVGYFLFKAILYQFVNWVFFDRKKIEQWNKSVLFLTAMEGLVAAPAVMLFVFGNLSLTACLIIVAIVATFAKICTFYKCYLIFFKRFGAFLQIFLYFCALELIPLVGLVELLEAFNNNLIINF